MLKKINEVLKYIFELLYTIIRSCYKKQTLSSHTENCDEDCLNLKDSLEETKLSIKSLPNVKAFHIEPYIKLFGKEFMYIPNAYNHTRDDILYYRYSRFDILVTPGKGFSFHCLSGKGMNVVCTESQNKTFIMGALKKIGDPEIGLSSYKEDIEKLQLFIFESLYDYKNGLPESPWKTPEQRVAINNDIEDLIGKYIHFY